MLTSRRGLAAFVLLLLPPIAVLVWLAAILLQQAFAEGLLEGLITAWVLGFVALLPVAMVLVPVGNWLWTRLRSWLTVPHVGENIPVAGQ